jgi:hypothetical protein
MRGIGYAAAILAAGMSVGTNMLLGSATDMPGVKYRHRIVRDKMGFQHSVHERIVPPIKATDADLFGSPKGKRAKRRHKK